MTLEELAAKIEIVKRLPADAMLPPETAVEVLAALGRPITEKTLGTWRSRRPNNPPFRKAGGSVAYALADLKTFAAGGHF